MSEITETPPTDSVAGSDAAITGRRVRVVSVRSVLSGLWRLLLRLLTVWRSPSDQPRWARPTLLATALLAGLAYGWAIAGELVEPFYGAAARSMSMSWRNFFFGAFDPAGTITVDKLPGELWVQALLLRATGFHIWALVLPQVIEGGLAVLVLYRAVRRLAGPLAGIVAALVLATSPITVLLNRGNISDSLLILLLLLAVDASSKAIATQRPRSLIAAGVWVGLAFQAKMLEAWIVLPAIGLAYLFCSGEAWRKRCLAVLGLGLAAIVVSLSWMTVVSVIPAHDRPYVDASASSSEFQQVFDYNGFARFGSRAELIAAVGKPDPWVQAISARGSLGVGTAHIAPGWNRLLRGPFGEDGAWLIPAAVLSVIGVGWGLRKREQREIRGALLLWGLWFGLFFAFFSIGVYLNSYYVAVLPPALGALSGIGFAAAWNGSRSSRLWIAAASSATVAYAAFLLPSRAGIRDGLLVAAAALSVVADLALLISRPSARPERGIPRRAGMLLALAVALLVPTVTAIVVVVDNYGPFDYPYEPRSVSTITQVDARAIQNRTLAQATGYEQLFPGQDAVVLTETSVLAQLPILATGKEFMPIGGLLGGAPEPSLSTIEGLVRSGRAHLALLAVYPSNPDARFVWLRQHCNSLGASAATQEKQATTSAFLCAAAAVAPAP